VGCFGANGLMITSIPEGRFVHWKGMELSDLLDRVDASSDELISRQVLMAEEGEDDGDLPIIDFDAVSVNEATANVVDKNDTNREAWRIRNRARAARRM
jgi:hypothetical protein